MGISWVVTLLGVGIQGWKAAGAQRGWLGCLGLRLLQVLEALKLGFIRTALGKRIWEGRRPNMTECSGRQKLG